MNSHHSRVAYEQSDRGESASFLQRMMEALRVRRRRSRAIRELQMLADWQLQDIGIMRADIAAVVDRLIAGESAHVPASAKVVKIPHEQPLAANDHDRRTGMAA